MSRSTGVRAVVNEVSGALLVVRAGVRSHGG